MDCLDLQKRTCFWTSRGVFRWQHSVVGLLDPPLILSWGHLLPRHLPSQDWGQWDKLSLAVFLLQSSLMCWWCMVRSTLQSETSSYCSSIESDCKKYKLHFWVFSLQISTWITNTHHDQWPITLLLSKSVNAHSLPNSHADSNACNCGSYSFPTE